MGLAAVHGSVLGEAWEGKQKKEKATTKENGNVCLWFRAPLRRIHMKSRVGDDGKRRGEP